MGKGDTLLNAVIGAVVTVVLAFTTVSPVLGGGVAGYLQEESPASGAKVGAFSGALAFLPFALFLFLVFGLLLAIPLTGRFGFSGAFTLIVTVVLVPVLALWNVGLGAVGGYLGAYLREERAA